MPRVMSQRVPKHGKFWGLARRGAAHEWGETVRALTVAEPRLDGLEEETAELRRQEASELRRSRIVAARTFRTNLAQAKRERQAAKKASLQLRSVQLLPGRHPCSCNARRHALMYNCLSCGAIICEQQGVGPCLFCGEDPNQERGAVGGVVATDEAARLRAEAQAEASAQKRSALSANLSLDDVLGDVTTIAKALGVPERGDRLVTYMRGRLAALLARRTSRTPRHCGGPTPSFKTTARPSSSWRTRRGACRSCW